ncbi:MAG: hypothetical protein KJ833_06760, partial [Alphaproteobacteria bacterium]|nr:hypothetical protein [Alphaproteobacteria bacterium]
TDVACEESAEDWPKDEPFVIEGDAAALASEESLLPQPVDSFVVHGNDDLCCRLDPRNDCFPWTGTPGVAGIEAGLGVFQRSRVVKTTDEAITIWIVHRLAMPHDINIMLAMERDAYVLHDRKELAACAGFQFVE